MSQHVRLAAAPFNAAAAPASVLQRECSCGGTCASCQSEEGADIQTKLTIGPPGDLYEQEADRVADRVVSSSAPALAAPIATTPLVQRDPDAGTEALQRMEGEEEEEEEVQAKRESLQRMEGEEEEEMMQAKRESLQRMEGEEEEEMMQPKAVGPVHAGRAPPRPGISPRPPRADAASRAGAAVAEGGRPLSPAERAYFEPRFGHDLSAIRLHADAAAGQAARGINARAYTLRNHIAFAPGQLSPATTEGRRLLAHELTHTLQQGAATRIRREDTGDGATPEPAPEEIEEEVAEEEVEAAAGDGEEGEEPSPPHPLTLEDVTVRARATVTGYESLYSREIVLGKEFAGPFYPGDVIFVQMQVNIYEKGQIAGKRGVAKPFDWEAPPDLSDTKTEKWASRRFRVVTDPNSLTGPKIVELVFTADELPEPVRIPVRIDPGPQAEDLVAEIRAEGRSARKEMRRRHRAERRAGTADRKAQRDERKALRKTYRSVLRDAKDARKAAIAGAESRRDTPAPQSGQGEACGPTEIAMIEQALVLARAHLGKALPKINPGPLANDPTRAALARAFNFDSRTGDPEAMKALLQYAKDVLSIARNSMFVSSPTQFACDSEGCDTATGAFVEILERGALVTVCDPWVDKTISFPLTTNVQSAQAYALIHEYCHQAGIRTEGDESYLHAADWPNLPTSDLRRMADAFAAFGWLMGESG